ncbi:MAG: B12-binding domain-containing radical SAM protein [Deltaproteobacteria bacterium]|nr:B12-binding domain-containing radical SAM protein [Deltaproteobacteria bacterium]
MGLRFVFVQKDPISNLATMCLSAVLKEEGHDTHVLIDPAEPDIVRSIRRYDPDVVCFSATTGQHVWQLAVARAVKERFGPIVLMGGPHPTFYPKVLEENAAVDFICMGEGEDCIVELARALESGTDPSSIPNLGWRDDDGTPVYNPLRGLEQEPDQWPFPDRSCYDHYDFVKKRRTVSVMSARGCPYKCTFCFNVTMQEMYRGKGKYVRQKSVDYMIAELKDVLARYPWVRQLGFADDIFVLNFRKWGKPFLKRYAEEIGLPFSCLLRPDLVTKEMVQDLKAANCKLIKIGLESGVEDLRVGVLKKGRLDNDGMRIAGQLIKEAGIKLYTFNIVGIPGETVDMAFETADLNIAMGADHAWASICQPYPGTTLESWSIENGYLGDDGGDKDFQYSYFIDTPLQIERKEELCNMQKLLPVLVSYPWLRPVVRKAIAMPANPAFELIFKAHYAAGLVKTGQIDLNDMMRLIPLTANYWTDRGGTLDPGTM